ncbi:hypothetical protein FQN60_016343, partial [Etheostoma spectabile]
GRTEIEQNIVELNRTRNSKTALILNVINLHDDLTTLRDLISTTENPDRISELQRQLEEKQEELNSKTADIERLIANPKIILTITELQDEIGALQKKAGNNTTGGRGEELQNRLDGLISEIDDKDGDITKLMLNIMTLQKLSNDLTTKKDKLQKYINELNEKNPTIAILILHSLLQAEEREHAFAQPEVRELLRTLQLKSEECSGLEERYENLKEEVNTQCDDLQRQLQQSQEDADRLQQQLHKKDANLKQLQQQSEEQIRENNSLVLLSPLAISLQNEKNKLEDNVQDLQNRLSNVEDKTIYARQVILDPNPAHPRIALSADDTRTSTSEEIQNVPDHPSRFNVVLAVLGTTGF